MENSIKFTLIIDKLNRKISELNIKISKDFNNDELEDRDLLYKGNVDDVKKIIEKYGDTFNE